MKHSPLLCIDGALNGNVVDDAFLEVMLRIEKEMHRLRAKGNCWWGVFWGLGGSFIALRVIFNLLLINSDYYDV